MPQSATASLDLPQGSCGCFQPQPTKANISKATFSLMRSEGQKQFEDAASGTESNRSPAKLGIVALMGQLLRRAPAIKFFEVLPATQKANDTLQSKPSQSKGRTAQFEQHTGQMQPVCCCNPCCTAAMHASVLCGAVGGKTLSVFSGCFCVDW